MFGGCSGNVQLIQLRCSNSGMWDDQVATLANFAMHALNAQHRSLGGAS